MGFQSLPKPMNFQYYYISKTPECLTSNCKGRSWAQSWTKNFSNFKLLRFHKERLLLPTKSSTVRTKKTFILTTSLTSIHTSFLTIHFTHYIITIQLLIQPYAVSYNTTRYKILLIHIILLPIA